MASGSKEQRFRGANSDGLVESGREQGDKRFAARPRLQGFAVPADAEVTLGEIGHGGTETHGQDTRRAAHVFAFHAYDLLVPPGDGPGLAQDHPFLEIPKREFGGQGGLFPFPEHFHRDRKGRQLEVSREILQKRIKFFHFSPPILFLIWEVQPQGSPCGTGGAAERSHSLYRGTRRPPQG